MIEEIIASFRSLYSKEGELLVKAPGRINLIGEHTDYNSGLVIPAAIDKSMCFVFASNDANVARVYAKDLHEHAVIDLTDLRKTDSIWINYLVGILIEFQSKGFILKGFDCMFSSDIPIGAGMSSSAALECGFALGMDHILGSQLDKWDIVDMSHHSNHTFMNIHGGIMDQFSSLFGKEGLCMLLNNKDRSFQYHAIDLTDYSIVIINTNVKHEHSSSGYNDRAKECKQVENLLTQYDPKLKSISDIDLSTLENIDGDWPENLKRRARFVVNENERVDKFGEAMKSGDVYQLGDLLYQSHHGLQHLFEVSCPELDILVDLTRNMADVLGARMMGGGFGGCTINLIKSDVAETISRGILSDYYKETDINAECYFVKISEGASVIVL